MVNDYVNYDENWFREMVDFFNKQQELTGVEFVKMETSGETPFYIPLRNFQLLNTYYISEISKYKNKFIKIGESSYRLDMVKFISGIHTYIKNGKTEFSFSVKLDGKGYNKIVYRGFDKDLCIKKRNKILDLIELID